MEEDRGVIVRVWVSARKDMSTPTYPNGGVSLDLMGGHLLVRDKAWRVVAVYDMSVVESANA